MKQRIQVFDYRISNQADNDALDIYIDGRIVDAETQTILKEWWGDDTSTSYKSFRDQITDSKANTFNVYINSGGGTVTDAMAMHDLLVDLKKKGKTVNTIGRGIIASAATYILMAGESRISKNSWFMIHNVAGAAWGDVNDIENYAVMMRKFNNQIRDFYAEATGNRKEDISKWMNAETWLTGSEAVEKGFVKALDEDVTFSNAIQPDTWMFQNMTVLNAYNAAVKAPPKQVTDSITINQSEMKEFFNQLTAAITNAIKGVKPEETATNEALVESIGNAVNTAIAGVQEQFETAVTEQAQNAVADALKGAEISNAISVAITNAIAEAKLASNESLEALSTKVSNLETKATDLENEIAKGKGKEKKDEEPGGPEPIGNFKK